jgi:small subunit ribosomal protein S20
MPHNESAKKRRRQVVRRTAVNKGMRSGLRTVEKQIHALVAAGKGKEAAALLPEIYQRLDKAAMNRVIHPNTAANHKAKIARKIARLTASKPS